MGNGGGEITLSFRARDLLRGCDALDSSLTVKDRLRLPGAKIEGRHVEAALGGVDLHARTGASFYVDDEAGGKQVRTLRFAERNLPGALDEVETLPTGEFPGRGARDGIAGPRTPVTECGYFAARCGQCAIPGARLSVGHPELHAERRDCIVEGRGRLGMDGVS